MVEAAWKLHRNPACGAVVLSEKSGYRISAMEVEMAGL